MTTPLSEAYAAYRARREELKQHDRDTLDARLAPEIAAVAEQIHEARKSEKIEGVLEQLGTKNKSEIYKFIGKKSKPKPAENDEYFGDQPPLVDLPEDKPAFYIQQEGEFFYVFLSTHEGEVGPDAALHVNEDGQVSGLPEEWLRDLDSERKAMYQDIIKTVQGRK